MFRKIILSLLYYFACFFFGVITIYISPEERGFFFLPVSCLFFFLAIKLTIEIVKNIRQIIFDYKFNKIYNKKKDEYKNQEPHHTISPEKPKRYFKKTLVSNCEMSYGTIIKKYLPSNYVLRPQICLASIIEKVDQNTYVNELFRIIDFGVFDQYNNILLLIEINDRTHNSLNRKIRDQKVLAICKEAEIPLLTFWTADGLNEYHIKKELSNYLI